MSDLESFRNAVTNCLKQIRQYDKKSATMKELARKVGFSREELSRKLNGKSNIKAVDVENVVRALAEMKAIKSRGQARSLLNLMDVSDFAQDDWQVDPLKQLKEYDRNESESARVELDQHTARSREEIHSDAREVVNDKQDSSSVSSSSPEQKENKRSARREPLLRGNQKRLTWYIVAALLIMVALLVIVTIVNPPSPQELYTRVTKGNPQSDSLNLQSSNQWDEIPWSDSGCAFAEGKYHVNSSGNGHVQECFAQATDFRNVAVQVQMTIQKGDGGGLILRATGIDSSLYKSYRFRVSPDGSYDLCADCGKSMKSILVSGWMRSGINTGLDQSNELTVIAQNTTLYLYVNGHYLNQVDSAISMSGKIGLFAVDFAHPSSVVFHNVKIWKV